MRVKGANYRPWAPDELAMSAARMALSEVADAWDALAPATGSAT